jgi:trimethylamine--corrinoid protein Co-methyltransferase
VTVGFRQKRLVLSGAYGPVNILDLGGHRRPGTMADFIDLTRLTQAFDITNIVGGLPVDPSDADPARKSFQMLHQILKHTDKPIWAFSGPTPDIENMFRMVEIAWARDDALWEKPVVAAPVCPLSPLKYADVAAETIVTYAARRQPIYINSCILAGASGPVSLLGAATLMNTEILAGLVLAQLINPGTPIVYVPGSTVADMRTGAYIGGSPESNLIVIAGIQAALHLYRLPTRVMGGLSDSKSIDYQAGAETMQNLLMPLMAGAHFLNNALGNMERQMTMSYAKFVLDVELVERALRILKGIDGADEDLSSDIIQAEAHKGNYLMNPDTFKRFKDRWRPRVSDWNDYTAWQKAGGMDAAQRAAKLCRDILETAPEQMIDPETDTDLAKFTESVKSAAA